MALAPAPLVTGPTRQPNPYGLFSVLSFPPAGADQKWQNGIRWETTGCEAASGVGDPNCAPDSTTGVPRGFADGSGVSDASPFYVYGSRVCTPVGTSPEDLTGKALGNLIAREEERVEQALWTGDLGSRNYPDEAVNVLPGALASTPQTISFAVAALEGWLADNYGSLGVLHMPRFTAQLGVDAGALTAKGSGLFTNLGTPVVAGTGYTHSTAEATYGQATIYATPPLFGYRTDPLLFDNGANLFDSSSNDLRAMAERGYVIGWDECDAVGKILTKP